MMSSSSGFPLLSLPNDIIRYLFSFLTVRDALRFALTSSALHTLLSQRTPSQWLPSILGEFGFDKLHEFSKSCTTRDPDTAVPSVCNTFSQQLQRYSKELDVCLVEEQLQEEFTRETDQLAHTYGFRNVLFVDHPFQGLEEECVVMSAEKHHPNLFTSELWDFNGDFFCHRARQRVADRKLIPKLKQLLDSPHFPKHKNLASYNLFIRGDFPIPPSLQRFTHSPSFAVYKKQHPLIDNNSRSFNLFISEPIDAILAEFQTAEFTRLLESTDFCNPPHNITKADRRELLKQCRMLRDSLGLADVTVDHNAVSLDDDVLKLKAAFKASMLHKALDNCEVPGVLSFCYADRGRWFKIDPVDGVVSCHCHVLHSYLPPNDIIRSECKSALLGGCEQVALFCRGLNALENMVNRFYYPIPVLFRKDYAIGLETAISRIDYARFLICLLIGVLKGLAPVTRDLLACSAEYVVMEASEDCDDFVDGVWLKETRVHLSLFGSNSPSQ